VVVSLVDHRPLARLVRPAPAATAKIIPASLAPARAASGALAPAARLVAALSTAALARASTRTATLARTAAIILAASLALALTTPRAFAALATTIVFAVRRTLGDRGSGRADRLGFLGRSDGFAQLRDEFSEHSRRVKPANLAQSPRFAIPEMTRRARVHGFPARFCKCRQPACGRGLIRASALACEGTDCEIKQETVPTPCRAPARLTRHHPGPPLSTKLQAHTAA